LQFGKWRINQVPAQPKTLFILEIDNTYFSLQRNVAGNSPAMEYLAFQNCLTYLLGCGVPLGTLITDRHSSIIKHMRERLNNIKHYFDLWHIKKSMILILLAMHTLYPQNSTNSYQRLVMFSVYYATYMYGVYKITLHHDYYIHRNLQSLSKDKPRERLLQFVRLDKAMLQPLYLECHHNIFWQWKCNMVKV